MPIRIDRCVCHACPFADLKTLAAETNTTDFESLWALAPTRGCTFGQTCQRCHPYVRAMLVDGRVVFDEVL